MSEQPETADTAAAGEQVTVTPEQVTGTPVDTGDSQDQPAEAGQDQPAPVPDPAEQQQSNIGTQSKSEAEIAGALPEDRAAGDEEEVHVVPVPDEGSPMDPHADAGTEQAPHVINPATSNESPQLAPTPAAGAAKAVAVLEHFIAVAQAAKADIERMVPPELLAQGEADISRLLSSL